MGTRADFYVGRGESAEWLGSYPFDGYPDGVFDDAAEMFAEPPATEQEWRDWVLRWLTSPEHAQRSTLPEHGWPWPWENSRTTDYAYAWEDGVIYGSNFGYGWWRVDPQAEGFGYVESDKKTALFPDMSERKAVTLGPRSGVIVIGIPRGGEPS